MHEKILSLCNSDCGFGPIHTAFYRVHIFVTLCSVSTQVLYMSDSNALVVFLLCNILIAVCRHWMKREMRLLLLVVVMLR